MNINSVNKYVAGFMDGDGCIMLEKLKNTNFTLRVKISQSNLEWVKWFNTKYPDFKIQPNKQKKIKKLIMKFV